MYLKFSTVKYKKLKSVDLVKDLGAIFDNKLNFIELIINYIISESLLK